jgi:transcriptional regulator with XRE-family HTH domain
MGYSKSGFNVGRVIRASTPSSAYDALRRLLTQARLDAELTQAQVAARLKRPQSFVSKYESGERQLDVIEFLSICKAIGVEPTPIIESLA